MSTINKEDYEEPCCPYTKPQATERIPIGRVIEKLDEYLNANDYAWAERHLKYWEEEARAFGDNDGLLSLLNEQIGLYRKTVKEEEAMKACEEALNVAHEIGLDGTVSMGTTLINVATAYKSFEKTNEAIELYKKAKEIYESHLKDDDEKLASLYNNMAVSLIEVKEFDEAEELFNKALKIMEKMDQGELEMAITHCNLADLYAAKYGTEEGEAKIMENMNIAEELLNKENLDRNGHYAFVCEKCAFVFTCYGYFVTGNELKKRAEEIYGEV